MSSINGLGGTSPLQQTQSATKTASTAPSSTTERPSLSDRLELSGASHLLQALKTGGGFRADKVANIKAQIESGTYETDDKLDAATDKMLNDVLK